MKAENNILNLMASGSDERTSLLAITGKNSYSTGFTPVRGVQRASCTSSSPSSLMLQSCLQAWPLEKIRAAITSLLDWHGIIALTPSGTDAEFLCTLSGIGRSLELNSDHVARLSVFITAWPEIGSGSLLAANLKHFCTETPSGTKVVKGQQISLGISLDLKSHCFNARGAERGERAKNQQQTMEQLLLKQVEQDILSEKRVVVFHFVHTSKTGLQIPSLNFVIGLKKRFLERILIVVDAAQFRITAGEIAQYQELGFNIIFTGSKFLMAPPFCGGIAFQERDYKALQNISGLQNSELGHYFDRNTFPQGCLPQFSNWVNEGLLLRWQMAICEWLKLKDIPAEVRLHLCQEWRSHLVQSLNSTFFIDVLDSSRADSNPQNTIVTFCFKNPTMQGLAPLKNMVERLAQLHEHEIGQPVLVDHEINNNPERYGLRIALGAPQLILAHNLGISKIWQDDQKLVEDIIKVYHSMTRAEDRYED